MWSRISKNNEVLNQSKYNNNKYIDLLNQDVQIYDTLKGFVKVKYLIRNIQKKWCNVVFEGGRRITVTQDHPFETQNGVVLAKDLSKEDRVNVNFNQYSTECKTSITEEEAWLNGFILYKGEYSDNVIVSIALKDENDIENHIKKVSNKIFGKTPIVVGRFRGEKCSYKDIFIKSNTKTQEELYVHFKSLFQGKLKEFRQIPNEVFSYPINLKYAFLAGIIDANGHINKNKKLKYPTVQIGSTNKELAIQQMLLAQSLGLKAKIYENHYNKKSPNKIRYRIEFFPNKKLVDCIISQKKKNHYKLFEVEHSDNIISTNVAKVNFFNKEQYSYDVTTESEHFEVSGIYSHNCRAFLSPYYEKGGINPTDETDFPVFVGRYNLGAVSLNLPMIFMKAKTEKRDFYDVLDHYLEMIRGVHKKTKEYFGEFKASCNPVAFCYGGLYKGFLKPEEKLKKIMGAETYSFGITALNELQQLYNQKSIKEDGDFVYEVLEYINKKKDTFVKEDNMLYAIYSTPMFSGRIYSNVYLKIV